MNQLIVPVGCGLAIASMSSAVFSHWWSIREFSDGKSLLPPSSIPMAASAGLASASPLAEVKPRTKPETPPERVSGKVENVSAVQKEFFQAMLDEMKQIRKENNALRDQMAETNRDLMKLEFRVDTHSASFRPLPTTEPEEELRTPLEDEEPGVLPPQLDVPPNLGSNGSQGGM